MAVVVAAEDVLAVLALRLETSTDNENTGMDSESCAETAKGRDECDSSTILTARVCAMLLPVLLSVYFTSSWIAEDWRASQPLCLPAVNIEVRVNVVDGGALW